MMNAENLRFGNFRILRPQRQLLKDEAAVPLGTRAFDLLMSLAERAGQIVSKPDLIDLVWGNQHIEEGNLHVQIAALRRALGPDQGLIQNVPGRGYRFAGELGFDAGAPVVSTPATPGEVQDRSLVGREPELRELRTMLEETRLLTIVGPGGVGKTRLAVALMNQARQRFSQAAYLVDFAPLTDAALVETAALAALNLPSGEHRAMADSIAAAMADRPALLLFDNCEHVLAAVAVLADGLLRRASAVSIIATSQEPLKIPGETVFRLDPLAVPPRDAAGAGVLERFGAVALFVRCAAAGDRRFRLDAENGPMIGEICRRLDGMPLALEMAAARAPALGIEGLRDRLSERLRMLNRGARTAAARHGTLRGTVAWSYELLEETDRAVFRGLGVFAGGFTAEAAAEVALPPPVDEWSVIDALSRLVEKSMVVAGPGARPRYHLLETLRMFAVEEMASHGEQDGLAERHAAYFDRLFDDAYQDWESTEDRAWVARMSPELDNLRAALDWAAADAKYRLISLAGSGALLWEHLSLFAEGRRYLARAETALTFDTAPAIAARLHRHIGNLWHGSDRPRAQAALERAEALYRALDDRANLGAVLALLGPIRGLFGATDAAAAALREARLLLQHLGRKKSLFNVLNNLGASAFIGGDMPASRQFFEDALSIAQDLGAPERETQILVNLAEVEFYLGEVEEAADHGFAAVGRLRDLGQKIDLGWALVNLTAYLLILDRASAAQETAREALSLVHEAGGFILRVCLQQWAYLAALAGNHIEAARLLGFVDYGFKSAGETREHAERQIYERLFADLERRFADTRLAHLFSEGASWSESDAIRRADALFR